jgi:hypothetical protein
MNESKKVTRTFRSGPASTTLVIPIDIARRQGLSEPSEVVVEETSNGIFIRKLNLEKL